MKSNEWPPAHEDNFGNIQKIRDQKLGIVSVLVWTSGDLRAFRGLSFVGSGLPDH